VLEKDEELFRHLQVTVTKLQSWTKQDIEHNLDGGTWLTCSQERPDSIAALCLLLLFVSYRGQVFIAQKDFDLTKANESVSFLREMYNLAQELDGLAGKLDPKNKKRLGNIKVAAPKVISLTSQAQHNKSPRTTLTSILEENREANGAQDDLGVFDADDIQGLLKKMDYQISFIVFGVRTAAIYNIVALTRHLTASVPRLGVKYQR